MFTTIVPRRSYYIVNLDVKNDIAISIVSGSCWQLLPPLLKTFLQILLQPKECINGCKRACNPGEKPGRKCCECIKSNGCFPSVAQTTLQNGDSVTMSDLQIGDRVQSGTDGSYIFEFSFESENKLLDSPGTL